MTYFSGYLLATVMLLATSCNKDNRWAFDQIHSEQEESRSTKLSHLASDPVNGIDLEFIQTQGRIKTFLNVHSTPIPPCPHQLKAALVTFIVEGESFESEGYRMEGGQRILLSENDSERLLEALKKKQKVEISLKGYHTTIHGNGFSEQFEKLQKPFPYPNPFHLPF